MRLKWTAWSETRAQRLRCRRRSRTVSDAPGSSVPACSPKRLPLEPRRGHDRPGTPLTSTPRMADNLLAGRRPGSPGSKEPNLMSFTPSQRPTREWPLLVLALALVLAICVPLWQYYGPADEGSG